MKPIDDMPGNPPKTAEALPQNGSCSVAPSGEDPAQFVSEVGGVLEICVDSYDSLLRALEAGADRIELCGALSLGGISPALGLLSLAKPYSNRVFVMVRPRAGDFCYSDLEFETMLEEIRQIKHLGFPGIVAGILTESGDVDIARMRQIVSIASPMQVTFHRAFDNGRDPDRMLCDLIGLGIDRVLTSGQAVSALSGAERIRALQEKYGAQITLMPGAGITDDNLSDIVAITRCREFHMSAKRLLPSRMAYCKEENPIPNEMIWENDPQQIRTAKAILQSIAVCDQHQSATPRDSGRRQSAKDERGK